MGVARGVGVVGCGTWCRCGVGVTWCRSGVGVARGVGVVWVWHAV